MYKDFEYNSYKVEYKYADGMLCVVNYVIYSPEGEILAKVHSVEEAKEFIDARIV